ncbi:MAG: peptidase S58 [Firmicutes bacterium ZCTH02-B6]|nr:MAG: peptidase S58 [Firmicutes bacterium ZCTH02-B6]
MGTLTDVAGIRVGHWTDSEALTGCTVVLCDDEGAVGGVDVRGGGPGTRETDLLGPGRLVERVHGIVLSGGSAFGLAAATGVMEWLSERGIGFDTGVVPVPIVPAAVIFDLAVGDPRVRPGPAEGYAAAAAASTEPVAEGNVGAGAGATAGKWAGMAYAMKTGIGTSSLRVPGGGTVGALVVCNPLGDVIDPLTARLVAGAYDREQGTFLAHAAGGAGQAGFGAAFPGSNTVLAVVATDLPLSKEAVNRVAQMAHDGIARAIYPAHTPWDGDTVFALATGKAEELRAASRSREMEQVAAVGAAAAEAVALALVRAARQAAPAGGLPAAASVK